MSVLKAYTIPLLGLKVGIHEYDFEVDSNFFAALEDSPIQEGNFKVKLYLDKRPDEMLVLIFSFQGKISTDCDRCLAEIQLPVEGEEQLVVKYADEPREEAEVIYLAKEAAELNVARFIYEYIVLSTPIIKVYDCQEEDPIPCDEEMLDKLDAINEAPEQADDESEGGSIWDALKGLPDN